MDRQAGFLLALLFLANFLNIEADTTAEPATAKLRMVVEVQSGSPWAATCKYNNSSLKPVEWLRNDSPLGTKIQDEELNVNSTDKASTIWSASAKKYHEGAYKCSPDAQDIHYVIVKSGDSTTTLTKAASTVKSNTTKTPELFGELFALAANTNLTCDNATSGAPVQWKKDNVTLPENKEHYELQDIGRTIWFKKAVTTSLGNYSCLQGDPPKVVGNYEVIELPAVVFEHANVSVVEGEKFTLIAKFSETKYSPEFLKVELSWVVNHTTYTATKDRVTLSAENEISGIKNTKITIQNMNMDDHSKIAGPITCKAKYNLVPGHTDIEGVVFLVVKDKLAALWPFLGICLEVVVLCAIILVYEKKRNKAELEESDTDQSPDTKPTPNKDSEVRHRK